MKKVLYFLGNKPAHMIHGLPLYRELGGECVVLSRQARAFCEARGLTTVQLDDYPEGFLKLDPRRTRRTVDYLNAQDGVVLFFETYSIIGAVTGPKKFMLFHGASLKEWFDDWRIPIINACDYVSALGPYREEKMRRRGVRGEKFVRIGFARWDDIIRGAGATANRGLVLDKLRVGDRPIVTYLTTWYGPTSVNYLGLQIASRVSEEYVLVFRPHPDTPADVIARYRAVIGRRRNVLLASESEHPDIGLVDLFGASDLFIGDTSSTIVDAVLTDKPILFALDARRRRTANPLLLANRAIKKLVHRGQGPFEIHRRHYEPIREVFAACEKIEMGNVAGINDALARSLRRGVDAAAWRAVKERMFYNLEGDNVRKMVELVNGVLAGGRPGGGADA